jgi:hypothetical protein
MPSEDMFRSLLEIAAINAAGLASAADDCMQEIHSSMALPPSLLMGQPEVEQPSSPLHDVSMATAIAEMARFMQGSVEDALPPEYRSPIEGEYTVWVCGMKLRDLEMYARCNDIDPDTDRNWIVKALDGCGLIYDPEDLRHLPPDIRPALDGEFEVVPTPKKLPPPCTEE